MCDTGAEFGFHHMENVSDITPQLSPLCNGPVQVVEADTWLQCVFDEQAPSGRTAWID